VPRADRRRPDLSRDFTSSIETLLENHAVELYKERQDVKRPVTANVIVELLRSSSNTVFDGCTFKRSSRLTARRILGETNAVDDLVDVPFTANDIKHFDEKKRMAEELDRAF